MKKFFLFIILILLTGCASKNKIDKTSSLSHFKKYNFDHPLYINYNLNKYDFDKNITNKVLSNKLQIRIDNVQPIHLAKYKILEKDYLDPVYITPFILSDLHTQTDCEKTKIGKVKIDTESSIGFNLLTGLLTVGILPILGGIPRFGSCEIDKVKLEKYSIEWINKNIPNRKEILFKYNNVYGLASKIKEDSDYIADLTKCKNLDSNWIFFRLNKTFPCKIPSCETKLDYLNNSFNKIYLSEEEIIKKLKKNNLYSSYLTYKKYKNLSPINKCLEQNYLRNVDYMVSSNSLRSIKKFINKHKKDYQLISLLESRLYDRVSKSKNLSEKKEFVRLFPNSKYTEKIRLQIQNSKEEKVLKYIAKHWFNNWHNKFFNYIEWTGKSDKYGWPIGKGKFILKKLKGGFISGGTIECTINTQVKNRKLSSGDVYCYGWTHLLFFTNNKSKEYGGYFNSLQDLNLKITEAVNNIIDEFNGKSNSICNKKLKKCLRYCNLKSSKGFLFNDRESCEHNCYIGKSECEKGNNREMRLFMCRGICKGVNESNGGFFGSSDYDKCVNNCINSGEF